jgi:hypothetical protein
MRQSVGDPDAIGAGSDRTASPEMSGKADVMGVLRSVTDPGDAVMSAMRGLVAGSDGNADPAHQLV